MLAAPLNRRFPLTTRRTQRCCTATKIPTRKLLINRRTLATRKATSIPNEKTGSWWTFDFILRKNVSEIVDSELRWNQWCQISIRTAVSATVNISNLRQFVPCRNGWPSSVSGIRLYLNEWLWFFPINDIHADPSIPPTSRSFGCLWDGITAAAMVWLCTPLEKDFLTWLTAMKFAVYPKTHSKTQSDLSFRNRYEFMRIRKDYLIIWNLDYRLKIDKYITVYVMYVLDVCVLMIHDICVFITTQNANGSETRIQNRTHANRSQW